MFLEDYVKHYCVSPINVENTLNLHYIVANFVPILEKAFIVKFGINRALYSGSVRKPNLPGDESVSLFLGFTIIFALTALNFNHILLI